ncbi:hypothetical protein [Coleofasciculus sp. G2-EDA-02]
MKPAQAGLVCVAAVLTAQLRMVLNYTLSLRDRWVICFNRLIENGA